MALSAPYPSHPKSKFARGLDRDEEAVEALVSRLLDAGLDDGQLEMVAELNRQRYARLAVLTL